MNLTHENIKELSSHESYQAFLRSKVKIEKHETPELANLPLDESLFDHQEACARWMLRRGRGLLAASFGLGKTRIQCAVAKTLVEHTGRPFLVVAPLGVRHQFQQEDGPDMGIVWEYVTTDEDIENAQSPFLITNYERVRDGGITPAKHKLSGASLDEGSVLRSLGSKTTEVFEELFANVPQRFVCTATPSPNNFREIIYYAHWLGVMDRGQCLTRFFQRNVDKAGDLQLNPAREEEFWMWVASWALFLYKPSDLGFDDTGYDLPRLNPHWHCVAVDHARAADIEDNRGQSAFFVEDSADIRATSRENRETLGVRIAKAKEILSQYTDEHTILWHHYEIERQAIEQELPQYTTVYGSQSLVSKEANIIDFAHGRIQHIATKESIAGSGVNWQRHCHVNIFLGPTFKFQDFIQAVHRTYRFQQGHPVDVHIIYAESQQSMVRAMKEKWIQHEKLSAKMREIVQEFGLSHEALNQKLTRKIGIDRQVWKGERSTLVLNDTVLETPNIETDSIDLIHTSVPFGNQYEYGINVEDFGHNGTNNSYHAQMDFLIPELLRILKPGRIAAIHVKDRIRYGWQTKSGIMEVEPFSDHTTEAFRKHGFLYEGRRTIVTDVVRENNSTYRLGYSEMCKDSSKMGSGLPEYLLLFRKAPTDISTSYADEPVSKDKAKYSLPRWQLDASSHWNSGYDYEAHVQRLEERSATGTLPTSYCCEPAASNNPDVWADVNFMQCLNNKQTSSKRIKHLCPLPIDIVRRTINLYSAEGELVYDPFSGLGTVPYVAVQMRRRSYGVELNPTYWHDSISYLQEAEEEVLAQTLFE